MGSQYKKLTQDDMTFIKKQKLFYIASSSGKEVNLAPKGYDSIRVLDESKIVYMGYPGSGNRTHRDANAGGEFTLVFNAFEGDAKILRLFCKAVIVKNNTEAFTEYVAMFGEDEALIRDIVIFEIYAVESSCGESVPYMEYKKDRKVLKNWVKSMVKQEKLQAYCDDHHIPKDLKTEI